jgi:branched-subunit amino acid ABC-type transport system permease component
MLSIVLIWAPAFALVPAGILGFALERPLSRRLIARNDGGFFGHLLAIVVASLGLWLLLRIAVVLSGPQTQIIDAPSLALFAIVGLSSALSWWYLVVLPGRLTNAEGGLQ